ncbi:M56 family metallopeptidase [Oscillospiraceae bacterium 38-13]
MSLLQMSFAGAVMILAIIVIRALAINLLPKKTFLALWGIAVMRLLLPFSIPSAFSVYSLIGNHAPTVNPVNGPQTVGMLPTEITEQISTMPGNISNTASPVSVWMIVWAVGVLVCAFVFAIAYWKCRQEFQTSLSVNNDFIKNWLSTHRLKRSISVRQSSRFSAPLTYGVFRPVILMPTSTEWENTKAGYARSLISMEETRSGLTPLCNNFNKNAIEERITAIMKIKKASIFSLVLALALVAAVTTGFATSAANATEPDSPGLVQMEFDNSKTFEKSINLADSDTAGGLVQISGGQIYDEHKFTPDEWAQILELIEQGEICWVD